MIYEPAEDSFLLQKHVKDFAKGIVLDMGTGSGILAEEAATCPAVKQVYAVDIQEDVIAHLKKQKLDPKIRLVTSDLFSNLSGIRFDTILFNPPYLPNDPDVSALDLDGGEKGYEVIQKFFDVVDPHLQPSGKILLIFSSLTDHVEVDKIISGHGFSFQLLDKSHAFFEDLFLYLIEKKN